MQDLLLEILCWTDRSDAIDALFLSQSGIKGRKAEDEINSAIYSFAFKVMMINNEPKQRNDDEINLFSYRIYFSASIKNANLADCLKNPIWKLRKTEQSTVQLFDGLKRLGYYLQELN